MPHKQKAKSWLDLKQTGNECFKKGQYGEAVAFYSQAIKELEKSNKRSPEDLGVLYSNRAASYLKDGNCAECVKDCNTSLDLFPYNIKSLLRRASASEALERYRAAYVDYKTALQIDCDITAAHDGTNRVSKALMEADGPSWRDKLPPLPSVPLAVRERLRPQQQQQQQNGPTRPNTAAPSAQDVNKARLLKEEGNVLVRSADHRKAIDKYTQSLRLNPAEVTTYTNRALCFLSVKQFGDAVRDCDEALKMDSRNIKALYRRAQAQRELKNLKACEENLKSLLEVEPKNGAALKMLQEVQK